MAWPSVGSIVNTMQFSCRKVAPNIIGERLHRRALSFKHRTLNFAEYFDWKQNAMMFSFYLIFRWSHGKSCCLSEISHLRWHSFVQFHSILSCRRLRFYCNCSKVCGRFVLFMFFGTPFKLTHIYEIHIVYRQYGSYMYTTYTASSQNGLLLLIKTASAVDAQVPTYFHGMNCLIARSRHCDSR